MLARHIPQSTTSTELPAAPGGCESGQTSNLYLPDVELSEPMDVDMCQGRSTPYIGDKLREPTFNDGNPDSMGYF